MNILRLKNKSLDYSKEIMQIVDLLAINKKNINIVGSSAIKSILFPNDYDCYELIKTKQYKTIAKKIQNNIKLLMNKNNIYIGDIKFGEINQSPIRWKITDILKGHKDTYLLEDALKDNKMNKIDIVALINGVYKDISVVYEFKDKMDEKELKHKIIINLKSDISELYKQKNYYKILKRIFSIEKLNNINAPILNTLIHIFNSDLGILNNVSSDISTLLYLYENIKHLNQNKINYEIDNFKNRLSHVFETNAFLQKQPEIIKLINNTEEQQNKINDLTKLYNIINNIVQKQTKIIINKLGIKYLKKHYFSKS